jgi:hypothetical protein
LHHIKGCGGKPITLLNGELDQHQQDVPNVYGFGHNALIEDFIQAAFYDREPYIDSREERKYFDTFRKNVWEEVQ